MRFWDSSAIVPLLIDQPSSVRLREVLKQDDAMLVWWASRVECISALARLERDGSLAAPMMAAALARLSQLTQWWNEVHPSHSVGDTAARLLRVHPLRAADSLQLAAAMAGQPTMLPFVTLDRRLAAAASKEGFVVVGDES